MNRAKKTFSTFVLILLGWPSVLSGQNPSSGTWKSDPAKHPFGLGAIATYTPAADGKEHFSNIRSREYDFAIDGKEYPTDRPGSTVAWIKTEQLTRTCIERIQEKPLREIHLVLASNGSAKTQHPFLPSYSCQE